MRILYIHSSYKPNDLIGSWFRATREQLRKNGGDAWFAIKFRHGGQQPDDIMVGDSVSCGIHARMFDYTSRIASSSVYYYNHKYSRDGHLFRERFKSEPVNDMAYFVTLFKVYTPKSPKGRNGSGR